jgi:hypothetical protein
MLGITLLGCSAAVADEASDQSCVSAAASRVPSVPGATIKALRILITPRIFRVPNDETSRMLEVEINSASINATYVYICKLESSRNAVLDLISKSGTFREAKRRLTTAAFVWPPTLILSQTTVTSLIHLK